MSKIFKINLELEANNEEEVAEKLQAFQDLQDNLEHEDLVQAVDMIVENPEIVDFIKDVAPEDGEELSLTDYISIARKAFVRFA